ncbi:MAG: histidine phosphatase family protein [Thiobacillus sp.]
MNTTLDLMRHGEPVGGRKYRGQIDDPLSERGWVQMHDAMGEVAPWTRVVSSPLMRCRVFAEALARRRGLPLVFEPRFKEVGFGEWEGLTAAEIDTRWPGSLARFKADPVGARPLGAEALPAFHARVSEALDEMIAANPGEHVLLVCHAGVIRMTLAWALHVPLAQAYRIEVASASLTRLRFESGHAHLVFHGNLRLMS